MLHPALASAVAVVSLLNYLYTPGGSPQDPSPLGYQPSSRVGIMMVTALAGASSASGLVHGLDHDDSIGLDTA